MVKILLHKVLYNNIIKIIEYLGWFIFLLPTFVFYFFYFCTLFKILFYKISCKSYVFSYPVATNIYIINFFAILPMRISFDIFYNIDKIKYSKYIFINYVFINIIVFLFGIPFIFIKMFYYFIKHKNILNTWFSLSTYHNKNLIFDNGIIIRNMFPFFKESSINKNLESLYNKNIINSIYKNNSSYHPCSYDKTTNIGTTTTHSVLKYNYLFKKNTSYYYIQEFCQSSKEISFDNIKDNLIKDNLIQNCNSNVMQAHFYIYRNPHFTFYHNKNNKQILEKISKQGLIEIEKYINMYDKNSFIACIEFQNFYNKTISDAYILINKINTLDPSLKEFLLKKNNKLISQLISFREYELTISNKIELETILTLLS